MRGHGRGQRRRCKTVDEIESTYIHTTGCVLQGFFTLLSSFDLVLEIILVHFRLCCRTVVGGGLNHL